MSRPPQTTLTEDAPLILDATCSTLRKWPKHATIRIDIRPEVHPDMVMDAKHLQFPDRYFDKIYCDPPHLIKPGWKESKFSPWFTSVNRKRLAHQNIANSMRRFGKWTSKEEWLEFVRATNNEFYRCIKPNGTLEYKLCETKVKGNSIKLTDLNLMTNFTVSATKKTISRTGHNSTYWLTLKPKQPVHEARLVETP